MSQNESNSDPKVIFSIVAICIIFFVLSYFRILEQNFWPSNREEPRQPGHGTNLEDPQTQFDSRALEVSILRSLPVFQYAKKVVDEEKQPTRPSSNECAICLGEFEEGDWLKHLPRCKHVFHISCIDAWFRGHTNCPLCRSPVYVHDHLSICIESPRSSQSLLETLRREDFSPERATHYQIVRSEILQNLGIRPHQTVVGPVPSH